MQHKKKKRKIGEEKLHRILQVVSIPSTPNPYPQRGKLGGGMDESSENFREGKCVLCVVSPWPVGCI